MNLVLTRIRLHGFKTFAQRVEIELASNITAIVGPNGCGKSNLVDAILWALGEANVRALRAQTPTEVLFSGSTTHKPLGLAEVALWFNNESRWLPLDVDEVQITRRLYRSGEWECWINRTPARLRDLADLFAGTGLGRGGYAIVGQGDIEALLSAPPDERRRWLEEVAGVALYRTRRKDALRDLEAARLHLMRVDDVLRELERQRAPLRHEAERALLYRELRHQLQQLERALMQYEYCALQQRLAEARAERNTLREQIRRTELAIAEQETQAEQYGQAIAHQESGMDTLRTVLQSLLTAEERMLGEQSRLDEREHALSELARALEEEAHNLQAQAAERQTRIATLHAELQAVQTEAQHLAPATEQAESEVQQLAARRRTLETAYQAALRRYAEQEQARQRHAQLHAESAEIQAHLNRSRAEAESVREALRTAQAHENALQTQVATLETEQAESEQVLQRLTRRAQSERHAVETLRARAHALEASLQAGEGASPAVRALLQAVRKGELQGVFVPVGAALTVPEPYQVAIGAALGSAVNDILTPSEAEARAAIEWLTRHRAGRLTFLPLDLVQPRGVNKLTYAVQNGVLGIAADLVQYDPLHEPAIRYLLGRVLIVDTLETATRLVRQWRSGAHFSARSADERATGVNNSQADSPRPSSSRGAGGEGISRIATLDGSVVQLSGAITGGALAAERSSLLRLKADLDRARAELHAAQTRLQEAETAAERHRCQHLKRQRRLEALRRQLREAAQQRLQLENELTQRLRDIQRDEAQLQRVDEQLRQLQTLLEAPLDADLAALEAEREQLCELHEVRMRTLAQQRAQQQQLETRARELRQLLEAEQRALSRLHERKESLRTRLQHVRHEQAAVQTQRASVHAELERVRAQIAHAQAELDARRAARQRLLEQSFAVNDRIRTLRAELAQYAERERALDLQIARAEVKLAEIEASWRGAFADEPLPASDAPVPDKPPVARAELERLRRALAELGEVNPTAADEYARLNERYSHLARQRADLEQTCAQLEQQLREIDAHARVQFLDTFEAVRQAFQLRFEQLFEGGQAELILTETRDPLSAGVLVEVQPPGKRRQRLELLSGGERALTAIALLFAFGTVKPSPLLILDEVDAALDGRNVQRFADYLTQMAQSSQILIVTHNPITTAVAQQWLGVSMTGGVSRVVPYTPPESLRAPDGVERRRAAIQFTSETSPQP
ncbi:MAG: AAA family ATPase [Fimbriimonadales bacterium]|nr:AAA family ATPase [Fimbriimonadales bacterium]